MKKYLIGIGTIGVAFAILLVSVFRSASVKYATAPEKNEKVEVLGIKTIEVNYTLPSPGPILPDSPIWPIKAFRDRIWYMITANPLKKAELALLFADKRLAASEDLFKNGKPGPALTTLQKGEKYLEIATQEETVAQKDGMDTSSFLYKLSLAALKHRQIIEENILPVAPETAQPEIIKAEDYSKNAFKAGRDALNNKGLKIPESPFSGD